MTTKLGKTMRIGNKKIDNLYNLAVAILKGNEFYFCHSYWILQYSTEDDSPGIFVGLKDDYTSLAIYAVVRVDSCADPIYINDEQTLRSVLSSLILLVKNWEETVSEVREEYR